MNSAKEEIIKILKDKKGDDFYRAQAVAKRHPEILDKQWGVSGQTLRELIEGYKAYDMHIDELVSWVEKQP